MPREDCWVYGTRHHPSHRWARGLRDWGVASWGAMFVTVRSDKIAQSLATCFCQHHYLLETTRYFNVNGPQAACRERRLDPWPSCCRRQEALPPSHRADVEHRTTEVRAGRRRQADGTALRPRAVWEGRRGHVAGEPAAPAWQAVLPTLPGRAPRPEGPVHTTRPQLTERRAPASRTPADSARCPSNPRWCSVTHRARLEGDVPRLC